MESELVYSIFGIVVLVIIIILVMRSNEVVLSRSQEDKKEEIISNYRQELQEALDDLVNDKVARVEKKKVILNQISNELTLNIYFDEEEIKEIILELSKE